MSKNALKNKKKREKQKEKKTAEGAGAGSGLDWKRRSAAECSSSCVYLTV